MPIFPPNTMNIKLPKMVKVRQHFRCEQLQDIETHLFEELKREEISKTVLPGSKVALCVGSRGINNIVEITRCIGDFLKELGAGPFVVPSMGSHGGATAEGQKAVLKGLGITEESVKMPIHSSMEVVQIGIFSGRIPVFMDRIAYEADAVIPIARIKPHTGFRGKVESGLCKMMAIGLGKHEGSSRLHHEGYENFARIIPGIAKIFIEKADISFGVAILENAYDGTAFIRAIPAAGITEEEPKLLGKSIEMLPRIQIPEIDVLVIEQIGKDISGTGMDLNVIDRASQGRLPGYSTASIDKIVVLDLSAGARGNACGIGVADFTTKSAFKKIDLEKTYTNTLTSTNTLGGKIPIIMEDKREAIIAAIKCCHGIDENNARIVKIPDTMHLDLLEASENLKVIIRDTPGMEVL